MRLIEALVAAGVTRIEAVAFVSPKAVPAMAGAAEVMAAVRAPAVVRYSALVPNVKGAELALERDVDELTVTMSLSETYNQRNVHMSIDESVAAIARDLPAAGEIPVDAVVSCASARPTRATSRRPTSRRWLERLPRRRVRGAHLRRHHRHGHAPADRGASSTASAPTSACTSTRPAAPPW